MAILNSRFINSVRLQRVTQVLVNQREMQQPLTFLNRTRVENNVDDDEMRGEWTGRIFAADIITNDARAVIVEGGMVEFNTNTIPNLKIGRYANQDMIDRLSRMEQGAIVPGDVPAVRGWYNRMADANIEGIRIRENALICGMLLDSVVYDKLGVKISGGFGMPADLKFNPLTPFTDPTSNPITFIQNAKKYAKITYGEEYNRLDMSQTLFDFIISSDEFKAKAPMYIQQTVLMVGPIPDAALNIADTELMQNILGRILKMTINIEDNFYYVQNTDGTRTQSRYLPINVILLSDTRDDNSPNGFDLARGVPTEARLAAIVGAQNFSATGEVSGPLSYFYAPDNFDPPNLVAYAVDRAFPRKHRKTATARINAY